jgi:hypothetical protein
MGLQPGNDPIAVRFVFEPCEDRRGVDHHCP